MATHSSVLAWRIPGTGEPGELQSKGSHRVRHDRSDLAAAAAAGKGNPFICNLSIPICRDKKQCGVYYKTTQCSMLLKDKIQIGGSNMRQKGRMGLDRAKDYNFEEVLEFWSSV